LIRPD